MTLRFFAVTVLIVAAAVTRVLPHPPNVAPIAAMALFGGATFANTWLAVFVPLAAMFLSDLILGFHGTMPFVYLSFLLIAVVGSLLKRAARIRGRMPGAVTIGGAALASSVLFFLVTNFGVWLTASFYPKTAAGLWTAYAAGLPFFRNTVLGDLFYCAVLFGGLALLERWVPAVRPRPLAAVGR